MTEIERKSAPSLFSTKADFITREQYHESNAAITLFHYFFFNSFFYLFDVSWIKAYCRGENTQTWMKDTVEGDCYGFGSYRINVQSDASLTYNPFRHNFPPKSLTKAPAGRYKNKPRVFVSTLMLTPCSPVSLNMHPHHASPYFSGALRWKSISFAKQSGRLPQHRGVMESDGWPPYREPWDRV